MPSFPYVVFFLFFFFLVCRDSKFKGKTRTQVDLSKVDRVQTGQQTRKFSRFAEKHRGVSGCSLSLIYGEREERGVFFLRVQARYSTTAAGAGLCSSGLFFLIFFPFPRLLCRAKLRCACCRCPHAACSCI